MTESLDPLSPGRRIDALDAVRGLALAGILLTNIPQLTDMTRVVVPGELLPIPAALEFVAHQRFFPIFAFLFGISFALFLDGAATRSARPRLVLLRRLLVLAGIGLLHHMAQPGEALLPYAVVGIGVLLPASLLPRLVVLVAGLALLIVALTWLSGGLGLVPGLFLLGLAVARYGVAATLDRRPRQIAVLFGVSAVVAAVTLPLQAASLQYSGFDTTSAVAGLAVAGCYTGGLLLLLRTPARRCSPPC